MANKKIDQSHPTVTVRSIADKIAEGFEAEGWKIVGVGGSQLQALMPLLTYLRKKGVVVHYSTGFTFSGSNQSQG